MKRFYLSAFAALLTASTILAAVNGSRFATRSVLSEGRWIKVGVEQTGIYEISYDTLRQMGFKDPESVAVYGNGGPMQSYNFINTTGDLFLHDDLTPVSVWHHNGKLYFYGRGVDEITFRLQRTNPLKGYFNRVGKNIYSYKGYYFLTEDLNSKKMKALDSGQTDSLTAMTDVISYVYHERDLQHNLTSTGQLFWGESLLQAPGLRLNWRVNLNDAIEGSTGWLQADIYLGYTANEEFTPTTFTYGLTDETPFSFPAVQFPSLSYKVQTPQAGAIGINPGMKDLYIKMETPEGDPTFTNLDFWLLSYLSKSPTLKEEDSPSQKRFANTGLTRGQAYKYVVPEGSSYALFNITDQTNPTVTLPENNGGESAFRLVPSSSYAELIMADINRPQLQISGYSDSFSPIANQNLHAYSREGADLLIICIPKFRDYAERIANLHRDKEGLKVVVATSEECYNEFSSGVPDPMAYRAMAKMLYMGETQLKNILLIGPIYADFRGVNVEKDPMEGLIAFQNTDTSMEKGAANVNDFFGMMDDYLSAEYLERANVEVGVGLLPIRFPEEAEITIKKIEDHLEQTDFAYTLNKVVNVGGTLDKCVHATQARDMGNWIDSLNNGATICTPLIIDAYGNREARQKLLEEINRGTTYMMYFGHGAEGYLGKDREFFTTTQVNSMTNHYLPVTLFAGCLLSNSDRGRRGMGETIVTGTRHGALASILATRETWSGQNLNFFNSFFRLNFLEQDKASGTRRSEPATLGEIVAALKTSSVYSNELCYMLIGDPALKIPVVNRQVELPEEMPEATAGEDIEISGNVLDADGNLDENFNGECVVRLMEPAYIHNSQQIVSKTYGDRHVSPDPFPINYAQTQLTMAAVEVANGRFKASLHIPASARQFTGKSGKLHVAVYDTDRKIGGGGKSDLIYATLPAGTASKEESDVTAPVIERLEYVAEDLSFRLEASDDYALSFTENPLNQPVTVWIDGHEFMAGGQYNQRIGEGNKRLSRTITLGEISYGTHCLRVKVRDAAGNFTEQETEFTYAPCQQTYKLEIKANEPEGGVTFAFTGERPARGTLYITDADGNQIASVAFGEGEIFWDLMTAAGTKAAPGHYKAYILEEGNTLGNGYSQAIDLPVI